MQKNQSHLNIKGMDLKELRLFVESLGVKSFRGDQVYSWIYKNMSTDLNDMSNIPNVLKEQISQMGDLMTLKLFKKNISKKDKTIKYLFKTHDNHFIEAVSIFDKKRHTVCLSSQVGCSIGCTFCATAKMGLLRNLKSGEIIDQFISIYKHSKIKITNIVFMGMGEPFLNYEAVIKASKILHDTKGFGIASNKITISTSGILPKIKKYIEDRVKFNLAISINASNNKSRSSIMPINKKWNIEALVEVIKNYNIKRRLIMFEYIMLKDFNDSKENARELSYLLKDIKCKINLIPFNNTGDHLNPSTEEKINDFANILSTNKLHRILVRRSKGQDIEAACGQLVLINTKKYD